MNTEQWRRVNRLLESLADMPEDQQEHYIAEAGISDPGLVRSLRALLHMAGQAEEILEPESDPLPKPGTQLGPYLIGEKLGQGGMGIVYKAERIDGSFDKTVAIKMTAGLGLSATARARFHGERNLLAKLQHPNIAQLLDGGETESGRPYLVMTYVEGRSLMEDRDHRKLSGKERIKLFLQICEGVKYAHANLVVHRDLKPANIMVDDNGEAKLLDFGIAQLLDSTDGRLTVTGFSPMSPRYAAPEQIRGERATTATDTYALGVVLYEYLSGRSPYHIEDESGEAYREAICRQQPRSLSHIADKDGADKDLEHPGPGFFKGDLEAILLKALAKDPADRYPTVSALQEDLERFLNGFPVKARGNGPLSRFYKACRRNPLTTITALILVMTISALTLSLFRQNQVLAIERDRLAQEKDRSAQTIEFLVETFKVADPSEGNGERLSARDMINQSLDRFLKSSFDQHPDLQAMMLRLFSRMYNNLGLFRDTITLMEPYERVWSRPKSRPDAFHAGVEYAFALSQTSQREKSEAIFEKLITLLPTVPDQDPYVAANLHSRYGAHLMLSGQADEAIPKFEKAIEIIAEDPKLYLEVRFGIYSDVATAYLMKGDLDRAEAGLRRALTYADENQVGTQLGRAQIHSYLGLIYFYRGQYDEAEPLSRKGLAMIKELYADDSPSIGAALTNLALILQGQGKLEEAEELMLQDLNIVLKNYGEDHYSLIQIYNNLCTFYAQTDRYEKAFTYIKKTLDLVRKVYPSDNVEVGTYLHNYAKISIHLKRYEEVEPYFRQALENRQKFMPEENPYLQQSYHELGCWLFQNGKFAEAAPYLEKVVALTEDPRSAFALQARRYLLLRDFFEQGSDFDQTGFTTLLADYDASPEIEGPAHFQPLMDFALILAVAGQETKASGYLEKAKLYIDSSMPDDHPYRLIVEGTEKLMKGEYRADRQKALTERLIDQQIRFSYWTIFWNKFAGVS